MKFYVIVISIGLIVLIEFQPGTRNHFESIAEDWGYLGFRVDLNFVSFENKPEKFSRSLAYQQDLM